MLTTIRALLRLHAWEKSDGRRTCSICGKVEEYIVDPVNFGQSHAWVVIKSGNPSKHRRLLATA